ncbi:MAG: glycosyltransferase family 2 protein [Burkholderiales bacterium]|nr:glycosyltransferase family 2 protein [Burkholderiales bacterium]
MAADLGSSGPVSAALLTVVVCTHDRAELLRRCLDCLDAARRPAEGVQVLVVANHCTDGTHAMLEARVALDGQAGGAQAAGAAARLPLRWLAEPAKGKSHALNRALAEVRTPLLAFVDDDQRVDAGFLVAMCAAARSQPGAALFCGRLLPDWDGTEPPWVHETGPYRIYPLPVPTFDLGLAPRWLTADVALPSGGNAVVRTDWAARIGPFSTRLGPVGHDLGGSEDSEWFLRALQLGARLYYEPSAVQYHHIDGQRLRLRFLLRLTYKRTASTVGLPGNAGSQGGSPAWAWRKLAGYALKVLTAWRGDRRRFYLMRCAAALGEIAGHRPPPRR